MPFIIKHAADVINARTNPLVVKVCKLEEKKHRESEHLFRLDGIKLLLEAVDFGADIEYVLVRDDVYDKVMTSLDEHFCGRDTAVGGILVRVGSSAFEKMSSEKSPEGVITVVKYIDKIRKICKIEKDGVLSVEGKTLMLESVRDPGNLGTMLRTAVAFGFSTVIMTDDCADIYNSKTIRAAMGAVFKLEILKVEDAVTSIHALRRSERRVLAAALRRDAVRLGAFDIAESDVFLIGNEGHGLTDEAVCAADKTVFIPISEGTESLNAAIAAAVCMWEVSKM